MERSGPLRVLGWSRHTDPEVRCLEVVVGGVPVDVLDTKTRTLVWRGIAENAFRKPNPDDEKVAKTIAKVMQDFPPM